MAACPNASSTNFGVCSVSFGGEKITCDLLANGDTGYLNPHLIAVRDTTYAVCAEEYCAWGTDAAGNDFCYEYNQTVDIEALDALGSDRADNITFYHDIGLNQYNLTLNLVAFQGTAAGRGAPTTSTARGRPPRTTRTPSTVGTT